MKKSLLFVPLALVASINLANAKLLDGVQAVVQDRPILFSDVTSRVRSVKQSSSLASILGVSATSFDNEKALNQIIEEKIVLSAAKEFGSEPSESEINKQISVIAAQNRLSVENLKKSLADEKIDFELYKTNMGVQLAKRAIIEKELRASTSGQSDQELRRFYEQNLSDELDLAIIRKPSSKAGIASLSSLRAQLNKAGRPIDTLLKTNAASDLGWNDPSTLNETFQTAISKAGKNAIATEAFTWNNASYIIVIKGRRKGSAENFEAAKEQIRQQLQAKDIDERFKNWIEQKKKTMNIVVNPA
jgi:parvulin-like peptidyl-prolyl isomerase